MINLKNITDEDYILYQVSNWAMAGLVDIVKSHSEFKFYSFLDELFSTNEVSGEPGWFIERIELKLNINYLKISDQYVTNKIKELKKQGFSICFWVNSPTSTPEDAIFTEERFWFIVNRAVHDFIDLNPEYCNQYQMFRDKYSL